MMGALRCRRNLLAWIPVAGVLIQLASLHVRDSGECEEHDDGESENEISSHGRGQGPLGQTDKNAAFRCKESTGKNPAHASSNDAGELLSRGGRPPLRRRWTKRIQNGDCDCAGLGQGRDAVVVAMEAEKAVSLKVAGDRLNKAAHSLSPDTGGSKYTSLSRRSRSCRRARYGLSISGTAGAGRRAGFVRTAPLCAAITPIFSTG